MIPFDVAIPAMHGLNGEDGYASRPAGAGGCALYELRRPGSSTGMDKIVMKAAFKGAGIPVLDGEFFTRDEWAAQPDEVISRLEKAIEYPMIVKPPTWVPASASPGRTTRPSCATPSRWLYSTTGGSSWSTPLWTILRLTVPAWDMKTT